ncbi:sensor histidine kinase [Natrialbaceae archaeon A-gly3]
MDLDELIVRLEDAGSPADVYEATVTTVSTMSEADASAFYAFDVEGFTEVASTNANGDELFRAGGTLDRVYRDGSPTAQTMDSPVRTGGLACRSLAWIPIDTVGVLGVAASAPNAFDLGDLRRLETRLSGTVTYAVKKFQYETELEETKRQLLSLISSVPGTIYRCHPDTDRTMDFVTKDVTELTGYRPTELTEGEVSWMDDVVYPGEREAIRDAMETAKTQFEPYEMTYRIITREGSERWIREAGRWVPSAGEFEGLMIDVTDRREHRRRLNVLNRVLRHNLRNDLNVVLGNARLLAANVDGEDEHRARKIQRKAEGLTRISDKARRISQLTEADDPTTVDVVPVVEGTVDSLRQEHLDVTATVSTPSELQVTALGSIDFALGNVLENAFVHGESSVSVTVDRVTLEGREWARLRVRDRNPPIDDQNVSVLAEGPETPLEHGSGLGLWIADWLISKSGGRIDYRRRDGENVVDVFLRTADAG